MRSPRFARVTLSAAFGILNRWAPFECPAYTGPWSPWVAPWLARWGRWKAAEVCRRASQKCPAYHDFLEKHGISLEKQSVEWSQIPAMTKESYVNAYTLEARCYGGRIPSHGTTVDESAGSSGSPSNWVRNRDERQHSYRLMQMTLRQYFSPKDRLIILNCAAMGPWGTGILVSTALADMAIVKSIGTDAAKLENSLRAFGTSYRYLIIGYPPFFKEFVQRTTLDLSTYDISVSIGAEAHTESLRDLLLRHFRTVMSGYGASDLEINLAQETPFTIGLRRWLRSRPEACQKLFGRPDLPMIFQYNPGDYVVEKDAEGNLLFTIARLSCASPKIRYNIRDVGGCIDFPKLLNELKTLGVSSRDFTPRVSHLPVLWLHGRSDLMVSFYGANVYPRHIETMIDEDPLLQQAIHSFQLSTFEDSSVNAHLAIHLEKAANFNGALDTAALQAQFLNGLIRCNQDFREISKLFPKERVVVKLHDFGMGPFSGREKRI